MTALPLSGLRILSFEQFGAGPYCSMFLADMGAEVIKIENPATGGDFARDTGPYFLGPHDSLFYQCFNLNKRSLALDLKHPDGRKAFEDLVARSDAVLNNLRGSQPAKLRLDYPSLKAVNPRIVCGHLSAYGRDNSRAAWPGYDYLMQAECGFLSVTGEPDGPPARFGLSIVDFMTGTMMAYAASATLCGLKSGALTQGCDIDLTLMDAALHQLTYPGIWYLNEGLVTGRVPRGAHPSITPSQLQKTKDGWVFVMCQSPKFWELLIDALGRPDLAKDARFADMAARLANRDVLTRLLDEIFETRTTAEWIDRLKGIVPVGPVYDLAQALDNPFLAETQMVQTVPHPDRPDMRALANPIRIDGRRLPSRHAPKLGQDTAAILAEIGRSPAEIAALRDAGAIAT
jgi:crotonobetainyl-CoA:carnitine CoA-transferase CaiB-like acyl-CoA transferase